MQNLSQKSNFGNGSIIFYIVSCFHIVYFDVFLPKKINIKNLKPWSSGLLDSGLFLLKNKSAYNELKKATKYWRATNLANLMVPRSPSFVGEKIIRSVGDEILFVQFLLDKYQLSRDFEFSVSKIEETSNNVSSYFSGFSGNLWRVIIRNHQKGMDRALEDFF